MKNKENDYMTINEARIQFEDYIKSVFHKPIIKIMPENGKYLDPFLQKYWECYLRFHEITTPQNKAYEARLNKFINKVVLIEGRTTTWKEYIDAGNIIKIKSIIVPKIQYNRRKYNRMNNREQEEYEKKLKETKNEYLIYANETECFTVKKMVFDYCKQKGITEIP
jgi:hypothetical protein